MIVMMKGGMIMNKNMKKVLALSVIGMFVLMFAFSFVAAQAVPAGQTVGVSSPSSDNPPLSGLQEEIIGPQWFVTAIRFLGLGSTWALVIGSIAVLIMVFAAVYEILGFSAFETTWVRVSIAAGVAVIAGVARGITQVVRLLMGIAGGSAAIATVIAIGGAIVFFVIGSFAKGRMKSFKNRETASKAEDAFAIASKTTVGHVKEAKAAAKALEE